MMIKGVYAFLIFAFNILIVNGKETGDTMRFHRTADSEIINGNRLININMDNPNSKKDFLMADIPIYKFRDNHVGDFIRQFCDTTFKYDRRSCKLLYPVSEQRNNSAVLQEVFEVDKYSNKISGVVVMNGNPDYFQMLILLNADSLWLNNMGLEKTNTNVTLNFRQSPGIMIEPEFSYQALMEVTPSGKVNITDCYYGGRTLLWYINRPRPNNEITRINDWVRTYYKNHGYSVNLRYLDE